MFLVEDFEEGLVVSVGFERGLELSVERGVVLAGLFEEGGVLFGGLSEDETAVVLGFSARTVRRDWYKAKSYLYLALNKEDEA